MLQSHYSLFDSFFAPTRVLVVSEERLREYEKKEKQAEIERVNVAIHRLVEQREKLETELKALPAPKYETVERERTAEHHGGDQVAA